MSFGIAIGDFIAVAKLIKDIKDSLQSVGGAKSQYQEIARELDILNKALEHIDHLKATDGTIPGAVDYIKFAAISCRYSLQEFLEKIKEYDGSLGVRAKTNIIRKTARKFRWSFGRSEDLGQLQMYLNTHVGTINMLLEQYGLEQMTSFGMKVDEGFSEVNRKLDESQAIIKDVKKDMSVIGSSLGQLFVAIKQHQISIEQFDTSLAEIGRSVRDLDTGMTYLQKPFRVEDALGFTYAIPSELGYRMLDAYIRCRFEEGAGSQDVALGNYEFFRADRRSLTITSSSQLTPGTRIVMAVIVKANIDSICARPRCASVEARPYPGGGFICSRCEIWFDKSTKRRHELEDRVKEVDELSISMDNSTTDNPVQFADQHVYEDEQSLKNVKIAQPDQSPKIASKQKLDDTSGLLLCDIEGCMAFFSGTDREMNLNRHKRKRHSNESEGRYRCPDPGCNKVFKRQDARVKHYRMRHNPRANPQDF